MATGPNNPFQNTQPGQPLNDPQVPKQGSSVWLWILAIIGGIGLITVIVCCGVGYWGYSKGTQMVADELKSQISDHPVIEEHIGEVQSVQMNLGAVVEEAKKQQESGDQGPPPSMVFDIKGSKGSGRILMRNEPGGQPTSVDLVLDDGSRHTIDLDQPLFQPGDAGVPEPEPLEDFDIDLGEPTDSLEPAGLGEPADSGEPAAVPAS